MYLDCYLTNLLFPYYPTRLSLVLSDKRGSKVLTAYDYMRLKELAEIYNGYRHVYVRLHPANTYNKILFDIDASNLKEALEDARKLVSLLEEEKRPYIVVFSGAHGFHVYLLIKPFRVGQGTAQAVFKSMVDYYAIQAGLKHLDTRTSHSPSFWVRLPNTVNLKSGLYAVYLSPRELLEKDIRSIKLMARRPRCPEYGEVLKRMPVDAREYVFVNPTPLPERSSSAELETLKAGVPSNIVKMIEGLVRPCVLQAVLTDNPTHFARTQFAIELCWLWFSVEEICNIIEKLKWDDYDRRITCYHVRKICEKVHVRLLYPASCRRLQREGLCLSEKCPYYPSMHYWWITV